MRRPGRSRRKPDVNLMLILGIWAIGADTPPPPTTATATAPKPKAPVTVDFKLAIAFYGVRKEPITTAELVVRGGVAYYFASESPDEIVIIDPAAARLEFLDLNRRIQAELTRANLDRKQAVLHKAIAIAIKEHEEAGGRADRVAAALSRALNDPRLAETFDPATHHLRLTNPAVTVDATGEPEPDTARLALIDTTLTALIELGAARDPKAIPPFIRLDSLHALIGGHRLRPAELSFVYRLAGPPRKHRWTYRLVTSLTAREVEALNRVVKLRERTPYVPFERYELRTTKATP